MKKIVIGSDHAGYEYKDHLIKFVLYQDCELIDKGTYSEDSVDYPDFVHPVVKAVINQEADMGILICGTGNGVAMTANKYKEIRAGLCWNTNIAKLVRQHNDANILCIPARFVGKRMATMMVHAFLNTEFDGGRHKRRIDKMCAC